MRARRVLGPVARAVRSIPGYRQLRRWAVLRLRRSTTGRRVARAVYSDLSDRSEVAALVAQAEERQAEQGAAALAAELAAVRREHAKEIQVLSKQFNVLKAQRQEELAKVNKTWVKRQEQRRRNRPPVSAGILVSGLYLADRPLILFDVRGVDATSAAGLLEEIATEQVLGCGFRPMFFSDLPDASVWRRYGHLCEQVPPEEGWRGVMPYTEYLAARMESIRADLEARWVMPVQPSGLSDLQRSFLRRCGR